MGPDGGHLCTRGPVFASDVTNLKVTKGGLGG
jgi:hypothetical protein